MSSRYERNNSYTVAAESRSYCWRNCPSTAHVSRHLIILRTLWGQYFCYSYVTVEETSWGSVLRPRPLWLVVEPSCECGQSRSLCASLMCLLMLSSGRSLTESHFQGAQGLSVEQTSTSWGTDSMPKSSSWHPNGLWPPGNPSWFS